MYQIKTLENGIRILTEEVPGVRSAAIGIWVGSGSRHENASEQGAAHFIEHMFFKGTPTRSAAALAMEMDSIGGQHNAFTTKENTCYYARTLDTHLPKAIDLLCDMFFNSSFTEEDTALERGVILEEIRMYQDNPEDICAERLAEAVYKNTPLAHPILGKPATLNKMTGSWLRAYRDSHYRPERIVVALAGSFTSRDVDDLTARFSAVPAGKAQKEKAAVYIPAVTVKKKATEQNNLTLAFPGLPYHDDRRFVLQLLSFLLGGGMSSRLFQEVREKRGLCYTVYSYGAGHADTGMFAIYTALGKETERQALDTIFQVLREFIQDGISPDELSRAREQSKASVLMGLESTQSRMSHLGRSALLTGRVLTPDEIIAAYDMVTEEQVLTLAREIFDFKRMSLSAVGRVGTMEDYRELLRGAAE
ncbi:MAG: peptidase [Oscillospiraceae bacterium]|nr:peptidase [Oscillospiraceae bacterium]